MNFKKNIFRMMILVGTVVAGWFTTSCNKDDSELISQKYEKDFSQRWNASQAKYTIMLYGCGGGDVDYQWSDAIEWVAQSLNVPINQVRFTVMYSMSKKSKQPQEELHGLYGTTYRYELTPAVDLGPGYHDKYKYKPASEVTLYKASTLTEYINWAKKTAPAENYILMPINHGGGFDVPNEQLTRGIAYDDNQDEKGISCKSIAQALKDSGTHLKVIYWYGCLMGQLEVLTEVAPYCDYQFASSHVDRVNLAHIVTLVDALNASPDDFEKAARIQKALFKEKFLSSFQEQNENCDFRCWRSDKIAAINTQVKKFGELLTSAYGNHKKEIDKSTSFAYLYHMREAFVDLLDYTKKLQVDLNGQVKGIDAINTNLKKAIDDACVYDISGIFRPVPNRPVNDRYGIGVCLFSNREDEVFYAKYKDIYKSSAFDAATGWSHWFDVNTVRVITYKDEIPSNPSNNSIEDAQK